MSDTSSEAIELHKKLAGKIEVVSKKSISSKEELALVYTPGVGAVSSLIAEKPELVNELTLKKNTIAVVSDGSAVLGLGNLGAKGAIPVMEGKAVLFKEFGGVNAFPICLDTQDTEEIISAVKWLAPVFGGINLEDIAAPKCFEIEERLKKELDIPVMHDDQHGTAVVVLAGLINALKVRGLGKEAKIVVNGSGAAGVAVTSLLVKYGFENIVVCDTKGAIYAGRNELNDKKAWLAEVTNKEKNQGNLENVLKDANVFVGVSKANLLTENMVKSMTERPIIFALANPIPEIMPDVAKAAGVFIVATGRSDFPNQINNVLAFPGIFKGALENGVKVFTEEMFVKAAEALAGTIVNPTVDMVLPSVFDTDTAKAVAAVIRN